MQVVSQEERTWAMVGHLLGLAGYVVPFGNIIAPLVWWLLKKDQSWFVNDQGREVVNFQISLTIYVIISLILMLVLVGLILIVIVAIGGLILTIIGAIKAHEGVQYRYPLTLRLIK